MTQKTAYEFLTEIINQGEYEDSAAEAHASWMAAKKEQGWTYGSDRNDQLKTNPALVPFEELPPSVKAANTATPYAVVNFFRTKVGKNTTLAELQTLLTSVQNFRNKELLAELSEYIHSHFIIMQIAQGENTKTRKDMVVFEDLDNDVKSWDTYIGLEVIEFLQSRLTKAMSG